MMSWAEAMATPVMRTALGALLALLAGLALGMPLWAAALLVLLAAGLLLHLGARQHWRQRQTAAQLNRGMARLAVAIGRGEAPAARGVDELADPLEALADELAAHLDELRTQQDSAAARLLALPHPILIIDREDRIMLCNTPACELLGLPSARVLGRRIEEVFTHGELLSIVAQARRAGPVHLQVKIPLPMQVRIWDVAAAPTGGRPGTGAGAAGTTEQEGGEIVLALHDVTEQARALQVRTDFVANASHELRTPIAALRAAVETLAELEQDPGSATPEMRQRIMEMLTGNIERLEEMARDLLDLSRVESPDSPVHIRGTPTEQIARKLTAMFEPVCRQRSLRVLFEIDPSLVKMQTDAELLELILRNLIDNATRFAFEGTDVRVTMGPVPGTRTVRIEVIDRGPGIPLAAQERIFERYFQLDTARTTPTAPTPTGHRRGSGLGLAIVKHAVRRLSGGGGGTIRVQSVWQQGTTMTIELPGAVGDGAGKG
jgi:two-component system, OmpR family, phosphate regulon sensor histidine kinase PhoR